MNQNIITLLFLKLTQIIAFLKSRRTKLYVQSVLNVMNFLQLNTTRKFLIFQSIMLTEKQSHLKINQYKLRKLEI